MDLHNLQPKTKKQSEKRIGRGGKRGTTSGRGTKGQKSRAGHKIRPAIRDLMMKIPKRRGFKFRGISGRFVVIALGDLDKNFNAGEKITPKILNNRGLIDIKRGESPRVKVLDVGKLTKKFILENMAVSGSAANKILALGGEIRNPKANG